MNILIVSDSHGLTKELDELKRIHKQVDFRIHCGDSELSPDHPSILGFETVKGNCDYGNGFPNQRIIDTEKGKILITHGHLDNVKSGLIKLKYKAIEAGANIVCFGHSHIMGFEMVEGILFLNPGSLRLPRMRTEKTYFILELTEKETIVHVYEYGKGKLFEEHFSVT